MADSEYDDSALNPLNGPLDPDPEDPNKATSLQECCIELAWKSALFFGLLFGFFKLGQDVSGVYLLVFPFVVGAGLACQSYTKRTSRVRLLNEYSLEGQMTHCTIIERFVRRVRANTPHHHHRGGHEQVGRVNERKTETKYYIRARYQARVPVDYVKPDGSVEAEDNKDVLVEHQWKVGRDLYYAPTTTLRLFYLPQEPKSGIPTVFVDPEEGDAGSGEVCGTITGGLIAGIPLLLALTVGELESQGWIALVVDLVATLAVCMLTVRYTHRISYTQIRNGTRAQIVGWIPRGDTTKLQATIPCSVPSEGEDDYGPTVSVTMGNSTISMVTPPPTTHRVGGGPNAGDNGNGTAGEMA